MKNTNHLNIFRKYFLCKIGSLLLIIHGLKLFYTGRTPGGWGMAFFVLSIVGGVLGIILTLVSMAYCMDALEHDNKFQIRTNGFYNWLACHFYKQHKLERMREVHDVYGNDYTDDVCIFCKKSWLDATKYTRRERKRLDLDQLARKAKMAYSKHLTKEEQQDLFIDRI